MSVDQCAAVLGERRRRVVALLKVAVVFALTAAAAAVVATVLLTRGDDVRTTGIDVTWDGSTTRPACVYDADAEQVDVRLALTGRTASPGTLSVTVTAYADEDTSRPVGSTTREVPVDGTVDAAISLTIEVTRAPFVDIDGVAACSLDVRR